MAKKKELKKMEELRKKELKESLEVNQSVKSVIYNVVGVLVVFFIFYFVTVLITNGAKGLHEKTPDNTPAEIQYKEILAGEVFNMPDEEYYVLFYDFKGDHQDYYSTIAAQSEKKVYTVDLSNPFNSDIVSEETNSSAQDSSSLKVKEATLIKIRNGKNISYFEGRLVEIKENIK